jgi:hypothetical protein
MNTYVVAYLSLYDGELLQAVVDANNKLEAYKSFLANRQGKEDASWFLDIETVEELENALFDMESYISAIQIF